jgi:hypothetical protein
MADEDIHFRRPLLFGRARRSVWPFCVTLVKTDKQWLLFNWIASRLLGGAINEGANGTRGLLQLNFSPDGPRRFVTV